MAKASKVSPTEQPEELNGQAGWRWSTWIPAVGLSAAKAYTLEGEYKPRTVKIGAATIITESPRQYLERISALQANSSEDQGSLESWSLTPVWEISTRDTSSQRSAAAESNRRTRPEARHRFPLQRWSCR